MAVTRTATCPVTPIEPPCGKVLPLEQPQSLRLLLVCSFLGG